MTAVAINCPIDAIADMVLPSVLYHVTNRELTGILPHQRDRLPKMAMDKITNGGVGCVVFW